MFSNAMFISVFLDHLLMTNILFDVNMYGRFFSISKLVNWVISDALLHEGLDSLKFSQALHMIVSLIMCLVLLKIEHKVFLSLLTLV